MAKYLIAISVGPVQDFIAAARRTRDLWYGSEVLSKISKSIAWELFDKDAKLIFPAPQSPQQDLAESSSFNVANKILAKVITDDPVAYVGNLKHVGQQQWKKIADNIFQQAHQRFKNKVSCIDRNIWDTQINDVLEIYCAWVEIKEDDQYQACRKRVDELLAARKNTRNFQQSEFGGFGKPKSSLDGLRESVLSASLTTWERARLGLSEAEHLDCAGLVKRLGGLERDQFTPISRIAIDPWLRGIESDKLIELFRLWEACESLIEFEFVSRVRGNEEIYKAFPYDGQLLYDFRRQAATTEMLRLKESDPSQFKDAWSVLESLESAISDSGIIKQYGQPSPYVAILHADGDRMGELLNKQTSIEAHCQISSKLAQFATSVPDIVREHRGDTVYAGGDDVLAILPLDKAIGCAHRLREVFAKHVDTTLSVGIAVGHFLTPMGRLLDLARYAEKLAKGNDLEKSQQKNALAIVMKPRSGAAIEIRSGWSEHPDQFLQHWINAHIKNEIPDSAAYQLQRLARELQWVDNDKAEQYELINLEVARVLNRKKSQHGKDELSTDMTAILEQRIAQVGLQGLANELVITRRFAEVGLQVSETSNAQDAKD